MVNFSMIEVVNFWVDEHTVAYEIRIAPAAERAIGKLSAQIQVAVLDKLKELAEDPRPVAGDKVKEPARYGVLRVKVGKDYRILYR